MQVVRHEKNSVMATVLPFPGPQLLIHIYRTEIENKHTDRVVLWVELEARALHHQPEAGEVGVDLVREFGPMGIPTLVNDIMEEKE